MMVFVVMLIASPAMAQPEEGYGREDFSIYLGGAFGAGLVILGAGWGIGRIGSSAV
jgi:hypothetical protein